MAGRLPPEAALLIEQIGADNRTGASQLTRTAAEAYRLLASYPDWRSASQLKTALLQAAQALVSSQPFMASLVNLCNRVLRRAETAKKLGSLREEVDLACEEFIKDMEAAAENAAGNAAMIIGAGAVVLTHSSSSLVMRAALLAHRCGKKFRLLCTESRPVLEGAGLARQLAREGLEVTVLVDAAAGALMGEADLVVTGADAVLEGGVVNKAGTLLLALAAQRLAKPLYVVAGTDKILPRGRSLPPEEPRDPTEVLRHPDHAVGVRNLYFDFTPADLVTALICEEGFLSPARVKALARRTPLHPALRS